MSAILERLGITVTECTLSPCLRRNLRTSIEDLRALVVMGKEQGLLSMRDMGEKMWNEMLEQLARVDENSDLDASMFLVYSNRSPYEDICCLRWNLHNIE